jgi:ketosteroid isomerase-like protein
MFEKNMETLQTATEAFIRRDREAWLALQDRDAEFRADPEWPEAETVRGRESVWDILISITDAWEQTPTNMVEVIDAGHDRLVARYRQPVQGKASGVETEFDYWLVSTFRGGKIVSSWWFSDRAKALQAAGLSEPAQKRRARSRGPRR